MNSPHHPFFDVRMVGFRDRASVADVLQLLESRTAILSGERVPVATSCGRVLAEAIVSPVSVPGFDRAAMDGYAVRAEDTTGATTAHPRTLTIVGDARPARPFAGTARGGEAIRITTGAPIPAGTDAIVKAESALPEPDGSRVRVQESVPPGKHFGRIGEDIAKGVAVLPAGRRLRPQDVGLIASIGLGTVPVVRCPRVAILVTGNELLPPGSVSGHFQIIDSNSPMLAALVARDGGECFPVRYVPDDYDAIRIALRETVADVVLISGGSSVGVEDHVPRAVADLGELPVHGVAIRPAGPMGVGFLSPSSIVFLLPGNPVSCLCAYDLFAGRVVRRLGGREWELPYRRETCTLEAPIHSAIGRMDYVRVTIENGRARPIANRGASNLSGAVAADGFVLVEAQYENLTEGDAVEVWRY